MKYSEISHFSHPAHSIRLEHSELPFKCDGCKEAGIGSRYRCTASCDFDLHVHCAIPSPKINHPFYTKCSFQFLTRPPGDIPRYCNACEKDVAGFVYHCPACGFDLHPCCAKLPMVLEDGEVKLHLYKKVSLSCQRCGRKGRSWSYRSTCKKYSLHVACVREMLVESWSELYGSSSHRGSKGTASASQRVLETRIPSLKDTIQASSRKGKGKIKKGWEMAGLALQFVVSAVLGDPGALIASAIVSLVSRG
ncbi:hypothetical protein SAY86_023983 [Trapa natans]|uniref:DC1 domain-containing protein n=1 Tax=Trapa natans TaxID=22666 RepID=A0AAN7RC07_TRANT|nr:hypothetical protein SAY86_023983 [Trapa natans]